VESGREDRRRRRAAESRIEEMGEERKGQDKRAGFPFNVRKICPKRLNLLVYSPLPSRILRQTMNIPPLFLL